MSRKPLVYSRKLLGSRVNEEMTWKGLPPLKAPLIILGSEKSPMIKLSSKEFFRHCSVSEKYLQEASLDLDFCAFYLNEDNASVVLLCLHLNGKTRNQDRGCHSEILSTTWLIFSGKRGKAEKRREENLMSAASKEGIWTALAKKELPCPCHHKRSL